MKYQLRYTPSAQKDMDNVWEGVVKASQNYALADKYVNDFISAIAKKKEYPESGTPLYYRNLFTGFYSINFKAYKAFYRIQNGYIEVIRILLQKQDYLKVLFEEKNEEK